MGHAIAVKLFFKSLYSVRNERQLCEQLAYNLLFGDEAYETAEFVADLRAKGITPHVPPNITTGAGLQPRLADAAP